MSPPDSLVSAFQLPLTSDLLHEILVKCWVYFEGTVPVTHNLVKALCHNIVQFKYCVQLTLSSIELKILFQMRIYNEVLL